MSLAEKKEVLLHIVEQADDKLAGLLIALANEYNTSDYQFTEDDIKKFEKRREDFFNSGGKGYSTEDSIARLRNKLK